jgi:acyl-CoA thioester hydrolase
VKYHKPARFDDELVLETRLTELRAASVRYAYTLLRDGILLAEGSTRLACVDDAVGVRRLPDDVREVFLRGEIP